MTNPVIWTFSFRGGIVRIYHNGMVDAIDGSFFSISPGFDSVESCIDWILAEGRMA